MSFTAIEDQAANTIGELEAAWNRYTESNFDRPGDEPAEARNWLWASGIRDCTRRMTLDLWHPDVGRDFDLRAMETMLYGREREAAIIARLLQVGPRCRPPFDVIEQQGSFAIEDQGVKILTGKVDGRLYYGRGKPRPIFEVKCGRSVERIETVEDFERSPWTRHMPDQLLLYLYSHGEPWGFFILGKIGGPKFIPFILEEHLDRVTDVLDRSRAAVQARFKRAPLAPFHSDASVCRSCPHLGSTCAPPIDYSGIRVIEDPELEELLVERQKLAVAAAAFRRLDKEVKDRLGREIEQLMCGAWVISGKKQARSWTEVPWSTLSAVAEAARRVLPEDSEAFAKVLELEAGIRQKFKKTDPAGTLKLTFEKIGEPPGEDGGEE